MWNWCYFHTFASLKIYMSLIICEYECIWKLHARTRTERSKYSRRNWTNKCIVVVLDIRKISSYYLQMSDCTNKINSLHGIKLPFIVLPNWSKSKYLVKLRFLNHSIEKGSVSEMHLFFWWLTQQGLYIYNYLITFHWSSTFS